MLKEAAGVNVNRDYLIDNLKFLLITAVVVGHAYEPYVGQVLFFKVLFICIYSFHMPAFVFISGYLSKSGSGVQPQKLVSALLIPYIVFSLLWRIRDNLHTRFFNFDVISPVFHLWYLLALFNWRLLLPVLRIFKHPLLLSILVCLVAGLWSSVGNPLALSRTFGLLPFFIGGTLCPASVLHAIHNKKYLVFCGLIPLAIIVYLVTHYTINWTILFWNDAYIAAGYSNINGLLFRLCALVAAALITISVIVITPSARKFISSLGARTLTVYILHGFFIRSFAIRFPHWNQNMVTNILIVIFPFLLVYLLSLPVLDRYYHKIFNAITKLFIVAPEPAH